MEPIIEVPAFIRHKYPIPLPGHTTKHGRIVIGFGIKELDDLEISMVIPDDQTDAPTEAKFKEDYAVICAAVKDQKAVLIEVRGANTKIGNERFSFVWATNIELVVPSSKKKAGGNPKG